MAENSVCVRSSDELQAWAYLMRVVRTSRRQVAALIAQVGVLVVAEAVRGGLFTVVGDRADGDGAVEQARRDLETAEAVGARLVTPGDAEWPTSMVAALATADGSGRDEMPLALWVRGRHGLNDVVGSAISVVGSRAATSYGEYVSAQMATGIVHAGRAVVSGGAYGVDGVAHRAALAAGGVTVAVLPCGIDRNYPAGHARLLQTIAEDGLLVSEYAPGTTPSKKLFCARNRLVAALSAALVVTEAGRRSGAAGAVRWARALDRPVGAVPGPVTSAMVGTNMMIADGAAQLVMSAAEVIALAEGTQ